MEEQKFDKKLKATLESRQMEPSKHAWEKLEVKLQENANRETAAIVANNKSLKNKLYWAAASVILMVGALFFYNAEKTKNNSVVTGKTNIENLDESPVISSSPQKATGKPLVEEPTTHRPFESEKNEAVVTSNTIDAEVKQAENSLKLPITFEEEKVNEVVAQIQELSKNREVTDAEINELLLKAQREIDSQKAITNLSGKVDAMALLMEVEADLDQSFKEKVLEALKNGFKKAKTAVAERNQ